MEGARRCGCTREINWRNKRDVNSPTSGKYFYGHKQRVVTRGKYSERKRGRRQKHGQARKGNSRDEGCSGTRIYWTNQT